ncbi:hypothetical protein ASPWEDRAFT_27375 [Aspergillus wentii DTO 134E9]|uniref:Amidohydrolase-related domain-containing protein n=1 Tax=Aspergillus wentii DTO 134E9 TaxID=1073089 RepID=A0A1L9RIC1_ASPWE|nr:uncharacterized protein ASPWEDRAFT_27375 [Aspergillus wentii DTO 134E9]KAI9932357.1 hypothetical protein MW887_009870 [Aspergillus wentii]OJJ34676.1 hypothetical protein ASPWEDRAFT_27375 [Aspergillus wentii DTO 134E9]
MSILCKNGTLLLHDEHDVVHPTKADLLIEDTRIKAIGENIEAPPGASIIDCSGKIISPGFIDTHHHLWQTCLKATHANETLIDYFSSGLFMNSFLSPDDIFWSQLAGSLECVDSGTTTVVDHASLNYSPDHSKEALRALITSGIRSVFAYSPTSRVKQWTPDFLVEQDLLAPWVMETFDQLASMNPFGPSGRVTLGFGFDGVWLPGHIVKDLFERVRNAGAQLITMHAVNYAAFGAPHVPTTVATLDKHGLLGPDILLSHNTNPTAEDITTISQKGVKISATPGTELQMGHGNPVCLNDGLEEYSSLGIDCHSVCSAYIPAQMMLALQSARARRHEEFEKRGKWAETVGSTVAQVFNLGTIQGARSIGMESEIGSLVAGKKADIVIYDCQTPGMLVAADRDPVAAIVLHSTVRDVDTVIVDGIVRKREGRLQPVVAPDNISSTAEQGKRIEWRGVTERLIALSRQIDEKKRTIVDPDVARKGIHEGFHLNLAAQSN